MKNFLAIYNGSPDQHHQWSQLDDAERKARMATGMAAWQQWMKTHAGAIVDIGTPLGKTKRIDKSGITDTSNNMTGYVIVRAESHEAAAAMFADHPHFALFPGDAVEIMPCMAMPSM